MSRRWKIASLAGLVMLCILAAILLRQPKAQKVPISPGATRANFDHVQFGMSLENVNEILGPPFPVVLPARRLQFDGEIVVSKCWISEDGQITLDYTDGHGVLHKHWSGKDGVQVAEGEPERSELQKYYVWLRRLGKFQ